MFRCLVLVMVMACASPRGQRFDDGAVGDAGADATDGTADAAADAPADAAPDTPADAALPPTLAAVAPAIGSVKGGTTITLDGANLQPGAIVAIGGIACAPVMFESAARIRCVTGDSAFVEGAKDVVVTHPDSATATLSAAFTYECPWTTSAGRRSCGAVPPAPGFAAQPIAAWVTQLEAGHGFTASGGDPGDDLDDTTDAVLGTQSAVIQTDGAGTLRTLGRIGLPPTDFTDRMPKLWVKIENVRRAATLQVELGDGTSFYRFNFKSTQGQLWATEGDWVAFTISWSPAHYTKVGTPDRAAITAIRYRIADDATGVPVRFRVDGIAAVAEPVQRYPRGVVSFTFDDNFASMVTEGLPPLAAHGFPATAYVIADLVGHAGRATLAELAQLQHQHGWEIAAHAFADDNHAARFTNIPADVLENDIVDMRAWLIANGFTGHDHCAYPGGNFTGPTDVLALARTYFASCRSIFQGHREHYLPADAHKLRVFYITNGVPLASALTAVDRAVAHREWIILVFHKLVPAPAVSTEWSIADYQALVAHVAAAQVPVATVGNVLLP